MRHSLNTTLPYRLLCACFLHVRILSSPFCSVSDYPTRSLGPRDYESTSRYPSYPQSPSLSPYTTEKAATMLTSFSAVAILVASTAAHMQLHYPPPFNASNNPHRTTGADPYLE